MQEIQVGTVWGYVAAFIVIISVVGGLGIAIAGMWYSLRVKQWELSLKHAMLERGMSAEEIKAVLEASGKERSGRDWWKNCCQSGTDAPT